MMTDWFIELAACSSDLMMIKNSLLQYPGRNTRPDNVLHSFGGKTVHVDVLVAQPVVHSAQLLLRHAARNGAAARRGEQRKRAKRR